jgi:hypothetical protein
MSMMHPTPYDGSSKLFEIGLKLLEPDDWIVVDAELSAYLSEKDRLLAAHPEEVFAAEPGTEAAQAEVLAMLAAHLPRRFPEVYRRDGDVIEIVPAGRRVALTGRPLLLIAASLVQEDLLLMRRGEAGWRLAAASLSFPSSWSLREKFMRPIHEIHAPVPEFGGESRNGMMIARMLDHLRVETPVIRWNWSVYGDAALFHPTSPGPGELRYGGEGVGATNVFLRAERQTLRRLPQSGDILFSVRITVDPLSALEADQRGPQIAAGLIAQLEALNPAQLAYKGMTRERDRLIARLREMV